MKRKILFNLRLNWFLKSIPTIFMVFGLLGFSSINTSAGMSPGDVAAKKKQANADLDAMAQEISKLVTHPGFRGFLRSEIAKSKNRENILELGKFLDRASKQKGMPPGLAKLKDSAGKAKGRLKASGIWENSKYDLYIPVEAHRAKWKGGKDFLIASSPVDDEKDVKEIVAYRVNDGKRVILNPNKAPESVVLVVAPCEHESHQNIVKADAANLPKPKNIGSPKTWKAPGEPGKYKGNSYLYAYYTMIRNDREPWYCGKPEIEVIFLQEKSSGIERDVKRLDCTAVDSTNKTYNTKGYGSMYFELDPRYGFSDITLVAIWERDGGSWIMGDCTEFARGRVRCFDVRSGDDYVALGGERHYNTGLFKKSSFQYHYLWERYDKGGSVVLYKIP